MTSAPRRPRMTGPQRRAQLIDVGRKLFASNGYDATSIEEVAEHAGVSKPVVYSHFAGKDELYAAIVDLEITSLQTRIVSSLTARRRPQAILEQAADALLAYVEEQPDGFRILLRESPIANTDKTLASVIAEVASSVDEMVAGELERRGYERAIAPIYSRALIGMIALVGQWWLDEGKPDRRVVSEHLVNLAWNGMRSLDRPKRG